jgi:hypothetical protein
VLISSTKSLIILMGKKLIELNISNDKPKPLNRSTSRVHIKYIQQIYKILNSFIMSGG